MIPSAKLQQFCDWCLKRGFKPEDTKNDEALRLRKKSTSPLIYRSGAKNTWLIGQNPRSTKLADLFMRTTA